MRIFREEMWDVYYVFVPFHFKDVTADSADAEGTWMATVGHDNPST